MTKEVAEKIAKGITDKIECNTVDIDDWAEFWGFTREEYEEFLDMAIKALEQQPCEDCISRARVLNSLICAIIGDEEQQPKTGHWIDVETLDSALWHECSECGETEFYATDYCPNCGAKMEV